jgi:ribosomal protein S18 acetylase RimI-like enzyme
VIRSSQSNASIVVIRRYQPSDREAVCTIAAETAFFGGPVETFLDDRRLFFDAFYRYYTDWEAQYGWVAVPLDGVAIGFVLGGVNEARRRGIILTRLLPSLLLNIGRGRYRVGRNTLRYLAGLLFSALRNEIPPVDLNVYPAHLHINIKVGWRGQGVGKRLLQAYLDQLRAEAVAGVHLHTTDHNPQALKFYAGAGFTLLAARPTSLWRPWLAEPVQNLVYGIRLGPIPEVNPISVPGL